MKIKRNYGAQIAMNDLKKGELFAFVDNTFGVYMYCGGGYYVCFNTGEFYRDTNYKTTPARVILLDGELTVAPAKNAIYNPNKEQD